MDSHITLDQFYKEATELLAGAGLSSASLDARVILCKTLGISDVDFITEAKTMVLDEVELYALQKNFEKRTDGMPVSRIFGQREFWGMLFYINEFCLDPRPDTETLIEAVIKRLKSQKKDHLKIIDFGTGSGCIPIALLTEFPNATATAIDICPKALDVAKKNADRLGVADRIKFICSDWDSKVPASEMGTFDVLVSNPPYIESGVMPILQREVIHFDPSLALDGGEKGLNPYEILIPKIKVLLKNTGKAFFEIGKGQENDLKRLIDNAHATLSRKYADIAGIIRVVEISCGDK
jgi:release factor glutamine methyltransferase